PAPTLSHLTHRSLLISFCSSPPPAPPCFFFLEFCPPPRSTLFPYTTLFRSCRHGAAGRGGPLLCAGRCVRERLHQRSPGADLPRSEEHTSELQSRFDLVCRLLLEKKKKLNGCGSGTKDELRDTTLWCVVVCM